MRARQEMSQEQRALANGLELCWQQFGPTVAPPMLLIAGLGAQMHEWEDELCFDLSRRGYRVIRFDNRDCGRSTKMERATDTPYLLADMAFDAVALLDALGVSAADVVGRSMGGMIAQEMAIRFPARVRTMTSLMSMTGEPDSPGPDEDALEILSAPPAETEEEYRQAYRLAQTVFRPHGFARDEARDEARILQHLARGLCPQGVRRQMAAVRGSGGRARALGSLAMPALVIHGSDDPLIPLAAGEATAQAITGARLVVLEHVGHGLPIETWLHVVDAIDETAKAA
jgi:pimeloyl-ACP methyl ester carboxylesterase